MATWRKCDTCGGRYHSEYGHLTTDYKITQAEIDCVETLQQRKLTSGLS